MPSGENPESVERAWDRNAAELNEMRSIIFQRRIKYYYFLTGLATASVVFTFYQTKDTVWFDGMYFRVGAVGFWFISVAFGLVYARNTIFPLEKALFSDETKEKVDEQIKGAALLGNWLFWLQHISLGLGMALAHSRDVTGMLRSGYKNRRSQRHIPRYSTVTPDTDPGSLKIVAQGRSVISPPLRGGVAFRPRGCSMCPPR